MPLDFTLAVPNPVFNNHLSIDYLNAVKKDVLESRTLIDKIVDFFMPRDYTINKYTERYHNALLEQFAAGFDSLILVSADDKGYTYQIENNNKTLTFSSASLCLYPNEFASGLIIAAADDNTISPDIHDTNNMSNDIIFLSGNAYGLNLAPLDAGGKYYMDIDNGILLVNSCVIAAGEEADIEALEAMVHFELKPMIVNIKKNENGQNCILPRPGMIEYNGSVISVRYNELAYYDVGCDIRDLNHAIDFMKKSPDPSSKIINTINVTGFNAATVGVFSDIASQPGNIVEGVPSGLITVRLFSQEGRMFTIQFDDMLFTADTRDKLSQTATQVYRNCVFANEWEFGQLRHSISYEQIFDGDIKFTDEEKSTMLARALTDGEEIIYNDVNKSLLFNNTEFKISLRTGSVGEGRGRHILDSLLEDENGTLFVDNEQLIKSLSYTLRNNLAIDLMSGKRNPS